MRPGITVRPPTSMTRVAGPTKRRISPSVPTATMRSPRTATACFTEKASSTVATFPLMRARSAGCSAFGGVGVHPTSSHRLRATRMRRDAAVMLPGVYLADGEQIDDEDERLSGLDIGARAAIAVAEARRDLQAPAPADLHTCDTLIPSFDH